MQKRRKHNYLMGILLDGEQYRKTRNTRDREVAQSSVLGRLGWKLVRVWTMEWWENREKQEKRLLQKIENLKEEAYARAEKEKEKEKKRIQSAEQEQKLQKELEAQTAQVLQEEDEFSDDNTSRAPEVLKASKQPKEKNTPVKENAEPVENTSEEQADSSDSEAEIDHSSSNSAASEELIPDKSKSGAGLHNQASLEIKKVDYQFADLPLTKMSPAEFAAAANRKELLSRIDTLIRAEAPIQKEALARRIFSSFGVTKQSLTTDTIEKALKISAVKNSKYKGNVFCWSADQDSTSYPYVRVNPERSADELPPHEIKNAICLILQNKARMNREDLITETVYLFGYKRCGSNLKAAIENGLLFAKANGDILIKGQIVTLPGEEE